MHIIMPSESLHPVPSQYFQPGLIQCALVEAFQDGRLSVGFHHAVEMPHSEETTVLDEWNKNRFKLHDICWKEEGLMDDSNQGTWLQMFFSMLIKTNHHMIFEWHCLTYTWASNMVSSESATLSRVILKPSADLNTWECIPVAFDGKASLLDSLSQLAY